MEFVEPYNRLSPPVWMLTPAVFVASLLITFVMRLWLSTLGHNFDFESYMEVVGLMERGKNVYAETCRYNYAPAWMWILLGLKTAFGAQFRLAVAVVPSLADIAIAWLLYRRGNKLPALLFVWAPVCIMISGFHNQFDNLAILIALLAVRYAETRTNYDSSLPNWGLRPAQMVGLAVIIGCSLLLKHVFIFFPFWLLAHRQLTLKNKMVLFVIPVTMFLGSFAPYWQEGHTGIIGNTFLYNPDTNAPLYNLFIGRWVIDLMNALLPRAFKRMFFVLMLLAGVLLRKKTLMDLILRYCLLIVLFASSVFTQHLVIPMVFLAMYESRWWTWYNGIGLLYFMLHHDQLHLKVPPGGTLEDVALFLAGNGHFIMVFFLFLAFVDLHFPQLLHRKYIYRKIAGKW